MLKPSARTNELVRYCLALAAKQTDVLLHAVCFLSNHWHGVVTDPLARLPEFLERFHRCQKSRAAESPSPTPGGTSIDDVPTSNTTGGVAPSYGGGIGGIGGIGGGLPGGLTECPAGGLFASAEVSDLAGSAKEGTNGKVRVTVTKLDEERPYELQAPADLQTRHIVLHGAAQEWRLDATIPGLTSELIKVGDVLDFQMEISAGYIPLNKVLNQVFGLFTPERELLLFGAHTVGYTPTPDLSFLGLDVSDGGVACGRGSYGGFGCQYAVHNAHFSAPGMELDLRPGHAGQLGNLLVGVEAYQAVLSNSGTCDDSGRSLIVGVKTAATNAK